jgi:hypothetical protein
LQRHDRQQQTKHMNKCSCTSSRSRSGRRRKQKQRKQTRQEQGFLRIVDAPFASPLQQVSSCVWLGVVLTQRKYLSSHVAGRCIAPRHSVADSF